MNKKFKYFCLTFRSRLRKPFSYSLIMVTVEDTETLDKVFKLFVNLEEQINSKMFQPGFKPFNYYYY